MRPWLLLALLSLSSCGTPAFASDLPTISEISCKRVRSYVRWYGADTVFGMVRAQGVAEETIQRKAAECRIAVPPKQEPWR